YDRREDERDLAVEALVLVGGLGRPALLPCGDVRVRNVLEGDAHARSPRGQLCHVAPAHGDHGASTDPREAHSVRGALRVASASESRDPSRLAQRTHFIDLTGPTVEL